MSTPEQTKSGGMSTKRKVLLGIGVWLAGTIVMVVVFGSSGKNASFLPQNEFKLDPWISMKVAGIDISITKAVLYVVLASLLTCATMIYIARRMQQRPNKVQTAVEVLFNLMRDNITRGNMDDAMARKWFPFIGALFLFIMFSNLIGYIPLPTNTEHEITVFGLHVPAFALYSATANLSIPLVLALIVWVSYTAEGVRKKGPLGYLKGLIPAGVHGAMAGMIFILELLSQFMRLISLSVRLFANILAGHLMILFFGGALAVLLGVAAIAWFTLPLAIAIFMFEAVLIAGLQAFIFATLTAIYLGGAVADHH
ncbi:MAG: F0F1 ATP synthase subunit A [Solirubrobacterales bacterium]